MPFDDALSTRLLHWHNFEEFANVGFQKKTNLKKYAFLMSYWRQSLNREIQGMFCYQDIRTKWFVIILVCSYRCCMEITIAEVSIMKPRRW